MVFYCCLKNWVYREIERDREKDLSVGSLPRRPQQLWPSQAETRSLEFHPGLSWMTGTKYMDLIHYLSGYLSKPMPRYGMLLSQNISPWATALTPGFCWVCVYLNSILSYVLLQISNSVSKFDWNWLNFLWRILLRLFVLPSLLPGVWCMFDLEEHWCVCSTCVMSRLIGEWDSQPHLSITKVPLQPLTYVLSGSWRSLLQMMISSGISFTFVQHKNPCQGPVQ